MSNLASAFKSEIIRLSRKEIKAAIKPLQTTNSSLRSTVSELKKRISSLEAENKKLQSLQKTEEEPKIAPKTAERLRISSKTIRTLRSKLGLSQESFGKLLGVSSNAVFSMEHKKGTLKPRTATLSNLLALKNMGKREVNKKLEEMK
jgi:DNA-binding transcriptional regulator YiaG